MDDNTPLLGHKRTSHLKTHVLVSVCVMIYGCSMEICGTAQPQYIYAYLQRISNDTNLQSISHQKFSKECNSSAKTSASDEKIQGETSNWTWYISLAQAASAIPVLIFAGPIADKIGRKPLILWNITVACIAIILRTFIVYKNLSLYYYVMASGILGLSGTFYAFHLANLAILADTTGEGNERTFLVVIYDSLLGLGTICSQIVAGYLIEIVGFTYPYLISSCMMFALLILILVQLEDPWKPRENTTTLKCKDVPLQLCSIWQARSTGKRNVKSLFSNFSVYIFIYISIIGFFVIRSIYVLGQPFCWSPEHIGWYNAAVDLSMYIVGGVLVRLLQKRHASIRDELIVLFGQISSLSCYILFGLSGTDMMLYIATATGLLRMLPISLIKAILSRLVGKDKKGVLFSNVYLIEAICNLGAVTIFTNIYDQTLSFYHGLVFFVMAAFALVSFMLLVTMTVNSTNSVRHELKIQKSDSQTVDKGVTSV